MPALPPRAVMFGRRDRCLLSPKSGHSRNPSSSWMSRGELGCHEVNATRHLGHFFISAIQEASAQVRVSTMLAPALAPPAVRRPRTSSTILPPGDLVVSVHDTQDWRCNGMRLQTPVTAAPWVRL